MLEILASVRVCSEHSFRALEPLVLDHAEVVSGCICVLLAWDEERQALVRKLKAVGVPVLVLVVPLVFFWATGRIERPLIGPLMDRLNTAAVRFAGEHITHRMDAFVRAAGLEIVESQRLGFMGIIHFIVARPGM